MSCVHKTKTQGGDRFWRKWLFWAHGCTLRAKWSGILPRNYFYRYGLLQNSQCDLFITSKLLIFFTWTFILTYIHTHIRTYMHKDSQTDYTQADYTSTDTCPPIHIRTGNFYAFLIPLTLICLLSSLHSWEIKTVSFI